MNWLLDRIWGKQLKAETRAHLQKLAGAAEESSRVRATALMDQLSAGSQSKLVLGHTSWDAPVNIAIEDILRAYGLVTGGTGSGKTRFALAVVQSLLEQLPTNITAGFGILDPKGDLYHGTLFLLAQRLQYLSEANPQAAKDLRRRIVIVDFGSREPVSSYNILARWPESEPDFFASNRAEMLLDLLAGSDKLSLGGTAVLQKLLLLLSEFHLPITYLETVLSEPALLSRLVSQSANPDVRVYFSRQFSGAPKATIAALRRRVEALFASNSVRLVLAGKTAPDFRKLQDDGQIVLVNCFGSSISRGVRRVLQGLVLSDIRQAVFARRNPSTPFLWLADEAQNYFLTEKLRDNMSDLLTMSRSFGTFFLYLTQNMTTAIQDARMLKILYTNLRWSFSMRGDPGDCAFLKSALPVTGRRSRPKTDPFQERTFCSPTEERGLLLDEISNLPDRTGYLWLRSHTAEAVAIRTPEVILPPGAELEQATQILKRDATVGGRMPRKVYDRMAAERDRQWITCEVPEVDNVSATFTEAYERIRGKKTTTGAI